MDRFAVLLAVIALVGCGREGGNMAGEVASETGLAFAQQDSTDILFSITGLSGPEAVKYDPDQDVYFISNFGPGRESRDGNGFISRVAADGTMENVQFAIGTEADPLHQPRGMALNGGTLWVADVDGLHAFESTTGDHTGFVDLSMFSPGFLNDVAVTADGSLYVTDTGLSRLYLVRDGVGSIAVEDPLLGPPNGVAWDAGSSRLLMAPWSGNQQFRAWDPATGAFTDVATSSGANFDGIELLNGRIIVSSQRDSSLHVFEGETTRPFVRTIGRGADIAIDTKRSRVAVPYIALNRVDVWQIR